MNNEPVAWMEADVLPLTHIIKAVVRREQDEQHTIPLYTHPADLTDEEIYEIWWQADVASDYYRDSKEFGIEFARAILRKAQKK